MRFTSILAHVAADDACSARLRLAMDLALAFKCELIGVGAEAPELYLSTHGLAWPKPGYRLQDAEQEISQRLAQLAERFEGTPGLDGVPHRWISAVAEPAAFLGASARGCDLIVASRPEPAALSRDFASPANLILGAGRPVLLAPRAAVGSDFDKVVVAWKDTRESRRALLDSLPFLMRAKQISVVAALEHEDRRETQAAIGDVVDRLAMLGVKAEAKIVERGHDDPAAALIGFANQEQASLIVAGAYGHSRLQELFLGGFTRSLLEAPVAVLFSH